MKVVTCVFKVGIQTHLLLSQPAPAEAIYEGRRQLGIHQVDAFLYDQDPSVRLLPRIESVVFGRRIAGDEFPNSWIQRDDLRWLALRFRLHSDGHSQKVISSGIPVDSAFGFWHAVERELSVVSHGAYRFREYHETVFRFLNGFFDAESPRSLCIVSSFFLVRHFEFFYVPVGFVGERRFKVFDDFEDGLLTYGFRGFRQPFFVGHPGVVFCSDEFVSERHFVEPFASVDRCNRRVVRVTSRGFKFSQQLFLLFRWVQFDVS